jgi:REP element-mobilizing transposase RayT
MASSTHTGWRSRGYLPHYDAADTYQHVIFRLHDSLPPALTAQTTPSEWRDEVDAALDAGRGERWLARPDIAETVESTLRHFDGERFALEAWCVMPTHVHALLRQFPGHPLAAVVQGWKSVSARRANARLGRQGRFWALDYFDRAIRDEKQLEAAHLYIEANPVAAGLCATPEAWPWSSAARRR